MPRCIPAGARSAQRRECKSELDHFMTMTRKNRSDRSRRAFRNVFLTVGWGLVLVLLASFFLDDMGLPRYFNMLKHARHLEQEIKDLQQTNSELRTEISRVQRDPARMEELARERLGYVRKGETVYQLVPPVVPSEDTGLSRRESR
jgi:cell division protein FtsB